MSSDGRIMGNPPGSVAATCGKIPLRLPVRDLERAAALVGDKDAIRLMAGLLDAQEIAALWGVSSDFVKDLGRRGILPRVKLGRLVKYRILDVLRCVEHHRTRLHPLTVQKRSGP